ncbi:tyrosine-protein kinase Mer isoform X2 [Leptinotarsa decemlineata]|uniref:tyrosine-protein kinase Mer isoform X2 n=1 Tax=Leptinotarsa decemlineata TaxID=7539 RepID=UPI003D3085CA
MDPGMRKLKCNDNGTKSNEEMSGTSWLSHRNRLFQQAEKHKKNHSTLVNEREKQNEVVTEKIHPSSTSVHDSDIVTSKKHVSTPSNGSMNNGEMMAEQSSKENDTKIYELECLDVIQHLVVGLTTEDDIFFKIINKILDLTTTEDSKLKALKYDLFDILLANLLECTPQELTSIEQEIKALVLPDSLKNFVVDSNALEINTFLGGFSSVVFAGCLSKDGVKKRVAIKKPFQNIFEKRIMNEAKVLSECDHENIVKIFGIVKKKPIIAIEMMSLGNLEEAILNLRFSDKNLLKICLDVATGMEYLHGKQYLHRNLTYMKVYINAKKQCKIGNFGSCVYVGDSNGLYEEKGLNEKKNCAICISPDTCISNIFRYQTDVWAMGILILAVYVASTGNAPGLYILKYYERFYDDPAILKPERCPDELFSFVMNHLLDRKYENRPSFTVIRKNLEKYF